MQEQLQDALCAAATLSVLQRQVLKLFLERLTLLHRQIETLDKCAAEALMKHQNAVRRLAEAPGLGADSAQQIIAEVGQRRRCSTRPNRWRRGSGVVRGGKKVRKPPPATGRRKVTGLCGAF